MDRFPVEVLYLLAFAGFLLFNHVMQKAARRRQEEEQAQQPPTQPAPVEEDLGEDIWGRTPAMLPAAPAPPPVVAARQAPPVPVATVPARRLHPVRALLRDRRDLRRAVALAMVLEPCRSLQPPER